MTETTALVTVVSGAAYERMAREMIETAKVHFRPTTNVTFPVLEGRKGWPDATMYRHHILASRLPRANYVFLIDADARFESYVGPEILPKRYGLGVTATLHPGYVSTRAAALPYERSLSSACSVLVGSSYYCGGFVGGERTGMRILSHAIASLIDRDVRNGYTPRWHDESALNCLLATDPPDVALSPAYAHPDNDRYYRESVWREEYERKIVMLDKPAEIRGDR